MKTLSSFGLLLSLLVAVSCTASTKNFGSAIQSDRSPSAAMAAAEPNFESSKWDVLDHKYFKVYYDRANRLPRYSIYTLTSEKLSVPPVKRPNSFRADPLLVSQNIPYVEPSEYKNSGFDRGHMAPYEDFAFSVASGNETFVMSNMSPQSKQLNEQSWKNLEAQVRKWGCGEQRIIVITGPIIEEGLATLKSGLPIPNRFFKIVIDDTPPRKAMGFVYSQDDDKTVKYPSRVTKVSDIEAAIQEDFESLVPAGDADIFSETPVLQDWKSADCRVKSADDTPAN